VRQRPLAQPGDVAGGKTGPGQQLGVGRDPGEQPRTEERRKGRSIGRVQVERQAGPSNGSRLRSSARRR
jgi:hypothetical protein